ncbi:MAG TPA: SelB C-terminal domain-containing protein [Mycobacterium sp.]|nr:SelB C-terminal domain-containing protein [Mycobacterium sp.]
MPLLEHLDRLGITERVDDWHRRLVPRPEQSTSDQLP